MPGPPPKPTELKRRLGNPGKQALRPPAIILPASTEPPPMPVGLKRTGKAAWQRYWTLGAAWLSPTSDRAIVERLCQAYDERDDLRRIVKKDGYTTKGSMGQLVAHPAVGMVRVLEAEIRRIEALCGFTPSDRSRLGLAEVQRVSRLEQFLSRQASNG